jgi:hypothetical protein
MLRAAVDVGRLQVTTCQHLQLHATYTKTASVVTPEDGRLTPKHVEDLRHDKVIVKVKLH